jgi:hypothetical protein
MNAHWRSIGGINGKREESDEWVLNASAGYCFEWKKRGHKAHECSQKKSNGGDERVSTERKQWVSNRRQLLPDIPRLRSESAAHGTGANHLLGLTVDDLRTAMNAHWRSIGGINGKREESDEWVLNASAGYCFECKERGHKAHECSQKKSNGGDERVSTERKQCGRIDHKIIDCWESVENERKRPS